MMLCHSLVKIIVALRSSLLSNLSARSFCLWSYLLQFLRRFFFFDRALQIIQMKIKLAIDSAAGLVRIRSKSRVKRPKVLFESAQREETSIISPVTMEARNASSEKERLKVHRRRSCSKLHCEHKSKKPKEVLHEDEYYNTGTKRRDWQREREELLRENEKLRRENKVLNDYFAYVECKEVLASREKESVMLREKEKVFSFKQMQEREFQGAESKTHKTSITKANSKMQYLEEFY